MQLERQFRWTSNKIILKTKLWLTHSTEIWAKMKQYSVTEASWSGSKGEELSKKDDRMKKGVLPIAHYLNLFYTCSGAEDRQWMGKREMTSSWKSIPNTSFINMSPDIFDNSRIFVHARALLPSNYSRLPRVKGFPTHFPTKLTVVVH